MSETPSVTGLADKVLKCKECGNDFIWTVGEQKFFHERGFKNKPARCKDCRQKHRRELDAEFFKVKCSSCGTTGEVSFQPRDPSAVIYCRSCFDERRPVQVPS